MTTAATFQVSSRREASCSNSSDRAAIDGVPRNITLRVAGKRSAEEKRGMVWTTINILDIIRKAFLCMPFFLFFRIRSRDR